MSRNLPVYRSLFRVDGNQKLIVRGRFSSQFEIPDWYRQVVPEAFPDVHPDDIRIATDEYGDDFFVFDGTHVLAAVSCEPFSHVNAHCDGETIAARQYDNPSVPRTRTEQCWHGLLIRSRVLKRPITAAKLPKYQFKLIMFRVRRLLRRS